MPPVSLSSTYIQEAPGEHRGYEYSRSHNPTRYAWERMIARLEGSRLTEEEDVSFGGFAFASGLAAIGTALELLDAGDHLIASDDLYGGTHRLFSNVRMRSQGLSVSFVDMTDPQQIMDALKDRTRMIWVETPSNPMLKLADLDAIVDLARERDILTACDNTFATPILQKPLDHGFDIVMHSSSKYLSGHSDCVGGVLVTGRTEQAKEIRFLQNAIGAIQSPFDAYMALRGTKTLVVRMQQHCLNASLAVELLSANERIERVIYPGSRNHPQHDLFVRQMAASGRPLGGGMVSIVLAGGIDASRRFLKSLRIFSLAESLGGVESLVEHPALMTHATVAPDVRAQLGIDDGLIRLSFGIEDPGDLVADLEQACAAM